MVCFQSDRYGKKGTSTRGSQDSGPLLALSKLNHSGYESHTGVADFACNFPASLRREDQSSGLKSGIAVALWNDCAQGGCWCVEPFSVHGQLASESCSSGPRELHA